MPAFEIGIVCPIAQFGPERTTRALAEIRAMAQRAEAIGFDTIWTPDELLWRAEDGPPQGVWDGVSMAGAVAAVTSTAKVGTWVMSALHRNPGIIAKTAETLDEISGGRFVFGLGAGTSGPARRARSGCRRTASSPASTRRSRSSSRSSATATPTSRARSTPPATCRSSRVGPRPGAIPLLIGGNGPKGQRHAALHADIWSGYAEERAHVDELGPRIAVARGHLRARWAAIPATIGRVDGVSVNPFLRAGERPGVVSGSPAEIARTLRTFRDVGYTQVELMFGPGTIEALEALAPVVELVRAD